MPQSLNKVTHSADDKVRTHVNVELEYQKKKQTNLRAKTREKFKSPLYKGTCLGTTAATDVHKSITSWNRKIIAS